jgi:hypothetical protein
MAIFAYVLAFLAAGMQATLCGVDRFLVLMV